MTPIRFLDLKKLNTSLEEEIRAAIAKVVAQGQFINGPDVAALESSWAAYCGAKSSVGCANGTAALHAILHGIGLKPGDEVILPSHTFIATAESVILTGATPVFADVNPDTWLLDRAAIEPHLSPRTKAIVPVHLYGMPADMDPINELACSRELLVVEDASQAHGARYKGRSTGSLGIAAAFSFFPGKNLGAFGDAGAASFIDDELASRVRLFVNHGRTEKYTHLVMGTNYRLDTIQAAILLVKLAKLEEWNTRRRAVATRYRERLSAETFVGKGLRFQKDTPGAESCWHLFVVRVEKREAAVAALKAAGIETGIHYPIPCHQQPSMAEWTKGTPHLPVTESLAPNILSLPMCPTMTPDDADVVCDTLKKILES